MADRELSDLERQAAEYIARSEGARAGWARRRLKAHLEKVTQWTGKRPTHVTLFAEDFDVLKDRPRDPPDVEVRRGPRKRNDTRD